MARRRRPSAYQQRPAMLPPGTHFRRADVLTHPAVNGEPSAGGTTGHTDDPTETHEDRDGSTVAEPEPAELPATDGEDAKADDIAEDTEREADGADDVGADDVPMEPELAEIEETDVATAVDDPEVADDAELPRETVSPDAEDLGPAAPFSPATRADVRQPANPASRWSRLTVLVLAGSVLVLLVTAFAATRLLDGDEPKPDATSPDATTVGPTPTQAATSPDAGPPVDPSAEGTHHEVTVLASGDLAVRQLVRSVSPLSGIDLAVPAGPSTRDGAQVSDLHIEGDGTEVDVPSKLGSSPVAVSLPGVHSVELTYRLSGVLVRSASRPQRALLWAVGLEMSYEPRRGPTTVALRGATLVNLVCTDGTGGEAPVPCGRRMEDGDWEVRAPDSPDAYRVMAVVDLPAPTSD